MKHFQKQAYHPFVLIAFYLDILPKEITCRIPRTTLYEWKQKEVARLFGYDWFCSNIPMFDTLKAVCINKRLMQINRTLLRIIALQRFIRKHHIQIQDKLLRAPQTVLSNIKKISEVLGLPTALKWLGISRNQYWKLQQVRCPKSPLDCCLPRYPAQLLNKEVVQIKTFCEDPRYVHWPLASVYHQMIRDNAGRFSISTFYKYVRLLKLQRTPAAKRRKNHSKGIRTDAPLKLLHADVTVFRTDDHTKAFLFLVQDNFSRSILHYKVAKECKASIMKEALQQVYDQHLQPNNLESCMLMTDDGSENHGEVELLVQNSEHPSLEHIIAQKDVTFSNSMIEAANKHIKYHFLYHKHIHTYNDLCKYMVEAIEDYNNRPHDVLEGLTPMEVLNGKQPDKKQLHEQIIAAKKERIRQNKMVKCCAYSF